MTPHDSRPATVVVPAVLKDLLDASDELRTFALQETVLDGSTFRQRMCALADLVDRETTKFVREPRTHSCASAARGCRPGHAGAHCLTEFER